MLLNSLNFIYFFLIKFIILDITICTISPTKNKVKPQKELKVKRGPIDESVFERDLISEEPSARDILVENAAYFKDTSFKNFNGTVLGYLTPWNNHGYDVAKIWGKKFDVISPAWLQIHRKDENVYTLAGAHDIDSHWMREVKKNGQNGSKKLEIYPRVVFDKFTETDFIKLLSHKSERFALNDVILESCKKYKFDGIVMDIWTQLSFRVEDEFLYNLVVDMAKLLKENNFKLILVIPPLRDGMKDLFSAKHFDTLYPHVHAFSLMTYDFSTVVRPGANAPLHWMKTAVENIAPKSSTNYDLKRKKILMGLNFYGNDYTPDGGGPIIGNRFLELVKNVKRLTFDEHDVENFFEISIHDGRHIVFYPTLHSIQTRLNLAKELGVGISIWELGQGLDYFYDLF